MNQAEPGNAIGMSSRTGGSSDKLTEPKAPPPPSSASDPAEGTSGGAACGAGGGEGGEAMELDLEQLNRTLFACLPPMAGGAAMASQALNGDGSAAAATPKEGDHHHDDNDDGDAVRHLLEDVSEDVRYLVKRLRTASQAQSDLAEHVRSLNDRLDATTRLLGRELHEVRQMLIAERKATTALVAFNAVSPALDRLRDMRAGLDPQQDGRTIAQVEAIMHAALLALRNLGFREFGATVGEPFDPHRMACAGYAPGRPGVVLAAVRPGYMANEIVARPAEVLIADPRQAGAEAGGRV